MARMQYKVSLTLAEFTFLQTRADRLKITLSAAIATCVQKEIERCIDNNLIVGKQWHELLIPGTTSPFITIVSDKYFNNVTKQFIDEAEVQRITSYANNVEFSKLAGERKK